MTTFRLTLSCADKPGIVAAVAGFVFEQGCTIREAAQFDDGSTGRFFMRVVMEPVEGEDEAERLASAFKPIARRFSMDWALRDAGVPRRVMILASRQDHCLADLLYRHRIGELFMTPAAVVSNHPRAVAVGGLDLGEAPFFHLPVESAGTPEAKAAAKAEQEARLEALIEETGSEVIVLARYMQVLSDQLSKKLYGRCINIHHSFLPGFKGAKPYARAFERGVKLIGATAHYVTAELDEGPIVEQDVERVSHADTAADLTRKGRDIERRVLARALRFHLEDRVLVNGPRTVVFN